MFKAYKFLWKHIVILLFFETRKLPNFPYELFLYSIHWRISFNWHLFSVVWSFFGVLERQFNFQLKLKITRMFDPLVFDLLKFINWKTLNLHFLCEKWTKIVLFFLGVWPSCFWVIKMYVLKNIESPFKAIVNNDENSGLNMIFFWEIESELWVFFNSSVI